MSWATQAHGNNRAGRRLGLSLGFLMGAAGAVLGFYSIVEMI